MKSHNHVVTVRMALQWRKACPAIDLFPKLAVFPREVGGQGQLNQCQWMAACGEGERCDYVAEKKKKKRQEGERRR